MFSSLSIRPSFPPRAPALYAKAKAAGAKMVIDLETKDYGGKAFSCGDPEGHIWHIEPMTLGKQPNSRTLALLEPRRIVGQFAGKGAHLSDEPKTISET